MSKDIRVSEVDILDIVANWKVDASSEDMNRYFFEFNGFSNILSGNVSFVVGRKGCGKTAIISYIESLTGHDLFANKITFGAFPFEEFSEYLSKDFLKSNAFATAWKYTIYNSVLDHMAKNDALPAEARSALEDRKPTTPERRFSDTMGRWKARSFSAGVGNNPLVGGLSFSTSSQPLARKAATLAEQVAAMEDFIFKYIDGSSYFILFDGLDSEVPKTENIHDGWEKYDYIITSLFKAALEVRNLFRSSQINVIPIVFVRDDIFELTSDSDKEKWSDHTYELTWRIDQIRQMLAYRITRSIDQDVDILSFNRAWSALFDRRTHITIERTDGSSYEIDVLQYIRLRTFLRPRDFIRYLQICAMVTKQHNKSYDRINPETVVRSEFNYAKRFQQELCDELMLVFPRLKELLSLFDKMPYSRHFTYEQFVETLEREVGDGNVEDFGLKPHMILNMLFRYSVLGNVRKFKLPRKESKYYRTFRYTKPNATLDINRLMTLHSAIYISVYSSQAEIFSNLADKDIEDDENPPTDLVRFEEID
ncbi:hypothetical protein [Mesorhizobium sp. B2-7-1]|uniref:P-loop ATPase, Sll1717 family n=1 Tax=Mesorhizobium sp. B2-7-1 TaxID=2589909 RepID=UPI00112EBEE7|nr:hypothetical protein [Mesorhizobium sp. B2-7-1]TPJ53561.1 hypothetical protein FJ471_26745 [Mesorhizobium sp. B2-7-1]